MRIVVVGDVLLDRDLDGPSHRLSPDAPVPVVEVERSRSRAGGAGLVALLLANDGHQVTLVTALSDDAASRELHRRLAGVEVVSGTTAAPTPVKTRVLNSGRPVVRFDEGASASAPPTVTPPMLAAVRAGDAVVVADYGRGLTSNLPLRAALSQAAARVPVVWDPHPRGSLPVPGVAVATPNLAEALGQAEFAADGTGGEAPRAAAALWEAWRSQAVVITLGADGAWVQEGREPGQGYRLAAPQLRGVDSCGAGDRFAGSLAVALSGAPPLSLGAAVGRAIETTAGFLRAGGVGSLPEAPDRRWPAAADGDLAKVDRVRRSGGTVVATGGCFDLVHAGHLRTLRAARAHGDALVVCLNSDASVRRLKGRHRPLLGQDDRAELLRALDCVDAVVVFEEDTPERLLGQLRPDVWVKGGDYAAADLPECALVNSWGGRCVTVAYHPGHSTSAIEANLNGHR